MSVREPELPSASGQKRRAATPPADRAPIGRAPRVPFALLVTVMVLGGMALLLALNTASAANELARHDLAVRDDQVSAAVQQLRQDVAASAAPANLARAAQQLGMVPAQNPAFLVIGPDGKVRVLGHAEAVTAAPLPLPPAASTHHAKPKAKTTAAASPSKSPSKSASKSASKSGSKSASTSASTHPAGHTSSAKPKPKPRPTPTPTPVYTLPGGPR